MRMALDTLDRISEALKERPAELEAARKDGQKVVGWMGYNVPEEMIHALGMIPVRLGRGGDDRLLEIGARYVSTQNCVFVRESAGLFAENKDPYVRNCDAVLVDATCIQLYRLADVIRHYFKIKTFTLGVPRSFEREAARVYFTREVEGLVRELEQYSGRKLGEKELAESVSLYNGIRDAVRELYRYPADAGSPIRWREVYDVVQAGFYLDRERFLSLLKDLLKELETRGTTGAKRGTDSGVRVLLSGSVIAPGDTKVIDIVERSNGTIVCDDLWSGLAPYLNAVVKEPTVQGIAEGYMNRIPHAAQPFLDPAADVRMQNLQRMAREYDAQGVIYHTLRYCDSFTFRTGNLRNTMKSAGIPVLDIHTEYACSDFESIRTRVEAFVELLEGNRLPGEG